ncbi:hypothetical protein B0H19DRAFT_1276789 [Mycena capillaripes]|nr:hypothetical protein B0H19DRAFT_1276789 [Mycena capillaripes]
MLALGRTPWISNRFYTVRIGAESSSKDPWHKANPGYLRIISTLNPALAKADDHLDTDDILSKDASVNLPIPENSAGFLYYHADTRTSPLEGSIRLRVTADNAPASFPFGQDLLLPSGYPRQITSALIATKKYKWIRDQLLHENLVKPGQLLRWHSLFIESAHKFDPTLPLLSCITQEFPVDFSRKPQLTVVANTLHPLVHFSFFFGANVDGKMQHPWTAAHIHLP